MGDETEDAGKLRELLRARGEQARQENRDSALASEREACLRIQELREARGWSQADLAQELSHYGFDMHQTTVAKLEKGKRPLRFAEATVLARIFGLPSVALFFMPVEGEPPEVHELRRHLELLVRQERMEEGMFRQTVTRHAEALATLQADRLRLSEQLRRLASEPDDQETSSDE